jgi:hypothetical protein
MSICIPEPENPWMKEDELDFCLKSGIYATSKLLNGKIIVVLQDQK